MGFENVPGNHTFSWHCCLLQNFSTNAMQTFMVQREWILLRSLYFQLTDNTKLNLTSNLPCLLTKYLKLMTFPSAYPLILSYLKHANNFAIEKSSKKPTFNPIMALHELSNSGAAFSAKLWMFWKTTEKEIIKTNRHKRAFNGTVSIIIIKKNSFQHGLCEHVQYRMIGKIKLTYQHCFASINLYIPVCICLEMTFSHGRCEN